MLFTPTCGTSFRNKLISPVPQSVEHIELHFNNIKGDYKLVSHIVSL